jgi:hypothetical protein
MNKFTTNLIEIFKTLAINTKLNYINGDKVEINLGSNNNILTVDSENITTPINRINSIYDMYKSSLDDTSPNIGELTSFINKLTAQDAIIRLNHIGICYKTESQKAERQLLVKEVNDTNFLLYEEPSNDNGLWLFIGNTSNWEDPLLELLPVEDTTDKWVNYWLPHFQIDIDTNLDHSEIERVITETFNSVVKPFRITIIDGVVYTVRARLGIVDGINIDLDIATKSRNVQYSRSNILKKLN